MISSFPWHGLCLLIEPGEGILKKIILLTLLGVMATPVFSDPPREGSGKIGKVVRKYLPLLQQLAMEKTLVQEVLARDNAPLSTELAEKIQAEWVQIGHAESEKSYLYNGASQVICAYESKIPSMIKCFVLDDQGNVVGTVPECSDFIHGQMNKFSQCYNNGKGRVFVNPAGLDVSTKIYSVQVSVPVSDGSKTIGVLVTTLSLE